MLAPPELAMLSTVEDDPRDEEDDAFVAVADESLREKSTGSEIMVILPFY